MGEWHGVTGVCGGEASEEDVWGRASLCVWVFGKSGREQEASGNQEEKWVWRNAWILLGMEKMGMKVFALPLLSIPPLSLLPRCHPRPPAAAIPCQAFVLNPLKAPLLLWQSETNKKGGGRRRAVCRWREPRGPRVSLGDGFCEQLRKSPGNAPPTASSYITGTPSRKCNADKSELKCLF